MRVARGHGPGPARLYRNGPGSGRPKLSRAAGTKDEGMIAFITLQFIHLPALHIFSCPPAVVISTPNGANL